MNRETKFRGWNKKSHIIVDEIDLFAPQSAFLLNDAFKEGMTVLPLQYIGRKDKKGKEIYEGDIVGCIKNRFGKGEHEYWSVEYNDATARFIVTNHINSERDLDFDFTHEYDDCPIIYITEEKTFYPEIIGNIYENEDLIKN